MSTAIKVAKSMVGKFEDLREVLPSIIEALEFVTLLTLPILLPFGIMFLALAQY
jgi:hypothetical protein|tara:strand:+ start:476 stop:637 length:162 start_codon:yes stop_codon:yes gene_type:complete